MTSEAWSAPRRPFSLSIALPGSIIATVPTPEQKTALAGQIARAAAVFRVEEIVVFTEDGSPIPEKGTEGVFLRPGRKATQAECAVFLARILEYLEVPQYLRKSLFPIHPDLRLAGRLAPLDLPCHMRKHEMGKYREGVSQGGRKVDCGLNCLKTVQMDVPEGRRVTLRTSGDNYEVVTPSEPEEKSGLYWRFRVRLAAGIRGVIENGSYDVVLGTSERGTPVTEMDPFDDAKRILVVFGGVYGLEECVRLDKTVTFAEKEISQMFTAYLNTCPSQGSRTIRTEEAILVSLSAMEHVFPQNKKRTRDPEKKKKKKKRKKNIDS